MYKIQLQPLHNLNGHLLFIIYLGSPTEVKGMSGVICTDADVPPQHVALLFKPDAP